MTNKRLFAALSLTVALAACVPPAPQPTPAPAPAPAPAPPPTPAPPPAPPPPQPAPTNWIDAPQTPGNWRYQAGTATFGEAGGAPLLILRCNRAGGTISIERPGNAGAGALTIRTETQDRALTAAVIAGPAVSAQLPAMDSLLDAMAFSRGRFAVEVAGSPALYVPAYPEVTRVIEDCR